jgi:cyclase
MLRPALPLDYSRIPYSNRREFIHFVLSGAAGLSFTNSAYGQAAPPIQATKLTDRIAVLSEICNIAVVIADDSLMMVDGGAAMFALDLQKAMAHDVDPHKVQILFNTHWHWDHVGSNETLGRTGTKIIAHDNAKKRLGMKVFVEVWNATIEPLKPEGLPTETFAKGGKMTFGKERIEYVHIPRAHTDCDAYVFLPGANILHTGDLFMNGMYPVIDYSTGGWIGGMAAALDTLLKIGDAKTKIIPGHGPIGSKEDMKASRDMLHEIHDRLNVLHKRGRSLDDVIAARPTRDFDDRWGKTTNGESFVRMAYTSIARHNRKA